MTYAENEAQGARGEQGRSDQHPDHPDSKKRAGVDGQQLGGVALRNAGATWTGASLAGGILSRLIQDAQERLKEARECIEWYQREEKKQAQRLQDLEELQALEGTEEGPPK